MTLRVRAVLSATLFGVTFLYGTAFAQTLGVGLQAPQREWRPSSPQLAPLTTAERHSTASKRPEKVEVHLSPAVGRALEALLAAARQHDWQLARTKLKEARAVSSPNDFDQFEISVMASFVALSTDDHETALASYRDVVASPFFDTVETSSEQSAILKNAMILSNKVGDYPSAITFGNRLISLDPIDDSSAVALAMAYFANDDFIDAKSLAQKAVDAAVAAGRKPDEIALQIISKSSAAPH